LDRLLKDDVELSKKTPKSKDDVELPKKTPKSKDDAELSKKTQKSIIERLAYIEYMVDKYYKELVKFYINKGAIKNPYNFLVEYQENSKESLSYQNLLLQARRDTRNSIDRDKSLTPVGRDQTNGELLELVKAKFDRFNSNNEYTDNSIYHFKTRRDYRINS